MNHTTSSSKSFLRKTPLLIGALFLILIACGTGMAIGINSYYIDRVGPNVYVGVQEISGLTYEEAQTLIDRLTTDRIYRGIQLQSGEKTERLVLNPAPTIQKDLMETIKSDFAESQPVQHFIRIIKNYLVPKHYTLSANINKDQVEKQLQQLFPETKNTTSSDASFVFIPKPNNTYDVAVVGGETQMTIALPMFFSDLQDRLETLAGDPIVLSTHITIPTITKEEAERAIPTAKQALQNAPYHFTYTSSTKQTTTFDITNQMLVTLLTPIDTQNHIAIRPDIFESVIEPLRKQIETKPANAEFAIENDRVTTFVPHVNGTIIDTNAMREQLLNTLLAIVPQSMTIALQEKEPELTTEKSNTFGIKELLGVGTSSYKGSPSNRQKNIGNGVRLLNGRLIAPGETFSLIQALAPFETSNGYLPELVIKGNEIKPEIGGGLCQIGTTTFRATMLSGLPVIERQNHSLSISYYNDPSNGNPGTDATIYDPAPDYKFKNDTPGYILFWAKNDTINKKLSFEFWGTSDGRIGSYSPPVVENWIPTGPPKITESATLAPGEKKCQASHVGANASFTYTVKKADGTQTDRLFESHYRALPEICLVGATTPILIPTSEEVPIAEPVL